MYLVLFGLGLLVVAAGFLTIGFGIPINAFSLGNTLIVAGTIAVVGGLVVVGLAAALRQLNRIGEALNSRPLARPVAAPAIAADTANETLAPPVARIPPAPAPTRVAAPPKPPEANMPRPPEPRFPAAASESKGPLDWLRSKPKTGDAPPIAAEAPDVADEAPLSPRAPQRPMFSPPPFATSPASEPPVEPKPWMPSRATEQSPKMDMPKLDMPPKLESTPPVAPQRAEPVARATQIERTAPQAERIREPEAAKPAGKDAGLFDVVWPDARSKPMPAAQPAKREIEPMPPQVARDEVRAEKRAEPASDRVAILKSGVIDGMAYTLYADGSIEAELPQGTVRFASVDALRAHLEKSA